MVVVVGGRVVVEVVITIPGIVGPPPRSRILQLIQVKPIQIGFIVVVVVSRRVVVVVGRRVVVEVVITIPGIVVLAARSETIRSQFSLSSHLETVKPGHLGSMDSVRVGLVRGKVATVRGTVVTGEVSGEVSGEVTGEVSGEVTFVCNISISQTIPSRSRSRYIS